MNDSDLPYALDVPPSAPPESAPVIVGPSWQDQDALLSQLWRQNKTPDEISVILGRSIAAIMTRAARLGLPRRSAPGRKPGVRRPSPDIKTIQERSRSSAARTASVITNDVAHETESKPGARVCLMCLRAFQSLGRHNRICPSCKGSSAYEAAVSNADIHFPA